MSNNNRSYNNRDRERTESRNSYRSRSSQNNSERQTSGNPHSRLSNYEREDINNKNSKYGENNRRNSRNKTDEEYTTSNSRRVPYKRNDENYDSRVKRKYCREKPVADLNELNSEKSAPLDWSSRQTSPLKRRNNEVDSENNNSPQKRIRENIAGKFIGRFNLSSYTSPKKSGRSSSLCTIKKENKHASTPKSERHAKKIKELIEQNSIAMERNMSKDWVDILEELEEQTKEVEKYIEKVSVKYKIDKDRLTKSMETEAETLRKRQKRINFGKVTAEYKSYITELPRKQREAFHPRTPNKFRKCSRRKFDGLIKKWRKLLHAFDENPEQLEDMRHSEDDSNDFDNTCDFGGASNVGSGISGYNIDDFDILDSDLSSEDKLVIETPMDAI